MIDHFSQERKISKGLGARAVGAPGFDLRHILLRVLPVP